MPNVYQQQFTSYGVGRWHAPECNGFTAPSHNAATTGCHVFPLLTPYNKTLGITKIGIYGGGSTGDAGATDMVVQVAMYSSTSGYYPDALLHDSGALTVNTNGIQTDGAFTEIQLTPNTIYWFAAKKNNTPSNAVATTANVCSAQNVPWMGYQTVDSGAGAPDDQYGILKGTQAGNYPATFAAGFAPATGTINAIIPFFFVNSVT